MNDDTINIILGAFGSVLVAMSTAITVIYNDFKKRINALEAKNDEQIKMIIDLTEKVGKYEGEKELASEISKKIDQLSILITNK